MKYMLLVYGAENALDEPAREACYAESALLVQDIKARGQFLATAPLHSTATATSVRVRDGKRLVTDGPFAETREQLGGYYVIEVEHLDQALQWAAKMPAMSSGAVEVRPLGEDG